MHPSSFYDLRARYIYTPLHGPYSLSEALDGLISHSLNESQDFIWIGSKRTLQHELISELSNVVDDLQDYLVYFSSRFLISSSNSSDLIKELWASYNGPKYLSVCWGALITRLVIARQIVEHNFWPHLFRPAINNLAALPRLGRLRPFVLPNASWKKSFTPASPSFPSSHVHNTPRSPQCPSESQRLPFGVRGEHPQTIPSETDPTGDKGGSTSSLRLDTTPTPSESPANRSSFNRQLCVTSLKSDCSTTCESRSLEASAQSNRHSAIQRPRSSTPAHASGTRKPGHSKGDANVGEVDEQDMGEMEVATEGEGVTTVPCTHSPPVQLTWIPGAADRELDTASTRTPSASFSSGVTHIPNSTTNLCPRPATLLQHPIPLPRSFAKANPGHPTPLSSEGQHAISSIPFHPPLTAQKRSRKAQPRRFKPSPVHSPTNFHQARLPIPSSHSISIPQSFANAIPRHPARHSLKGQRTRCPVLSTPFYFPTSAQRPTPKIQTQRFGCSSPPRYQLTPPSTPSPTNFSSSHSQRRPNTQNEHLGALLARAPPAAEAIPYISNSPSDLHCGLMHPPPSSISLPHSSTNTISRPSTRFLSKGQRPRHSISPVPIRSLLSAQKQPLKAQPQRLGPSPVHLLATPPFQRPPVNFRSTYPTSDTFQPCQVNQWSLREPPLSIVVDIPDDTSSSGHDFPSVLPAIPSDDLNRPLNIALEPCLPQTHENRSNEVFTPSNHTITSRRFCSSTPARTSETREPGDGEDNAKAAGIDEQVSREAEVVGEGEDVTEVPATANVHQGPTLPLPRSIPLPRSFANANSWHSNHPSSKEQRVQRPISSVPFHFPLTARKRLSKSQRRGFESLPISLPTSPTFHPFQQRSLDFYPCSHAFQPYRDDQWSPKESPLPVTVDNASDTALSMHDVPSVFPFPSRDLHQHHASLHSGSTTPFPPKRRCSSLSPPLCQHDNFRVRRLSRTQSNLSRASKGSRLSLSRSQLTPSSTTVSIPSSVPSQDSYQYLASPLSHPLTPVVPLKSCFPQKRENRSPEVSASLNDTMATQFFHGLAPAHVDEARELGDGKDNAKAVGIDNQVSRETEVAGGGEDITKVPGAFASPVTQDGQSRTTTSRAALTVENKGCSSPLTPNTQPPVLLAPISLASPFAGRSSFQTPSTHTNCTLNVPQPNPGGTSISSISSPPMPLVDGYGDDSSSDQDSMLDPLTDCATTSSTLSLEPLEGLDELQRANAEHEPALPTTPPFQRHLFAFQTTYPTSYTFQLCQADQGLTREPPSLTTVDIATHMSSSIHDPSIPPPAPPRNLDQHSASLHPRPPTPFYPKQRSVSLFPPFCQLENFRSRQLSGSQTTESINSFGCDNHGCSSPDRQGLLAQGQLGNLEDSVTVVGTSERVTGDVEVADEGLGFTMAPSSPSSPSMVPESTSTTPSEMSPMAQLMQEYSSAETGIMSVLSLGELTPDLIVDRGKDGTRGLRRYHIVKATLDNICMVIMAQQTFVQRAAALLVEGKSQFIVDPRDTLIPILQGTNSLPQLYVAWKALMARMRLGVKTWGKYVAEYKLQVGACC